MAGMQPVTAVPSTQIVSSQAARQALNFMILDILEYSIEALLISYIVTMSWRMVQSFQYGLELEPYCTAVIRLTD